jgi:hypothetical protein
MGDYSNLLQETLDVLQENGKTEKDILWCQNEEGWFTWEEFKKAADFVYDSGFGFVEIKETLKIVGKDFWLERHEYDGSEWWEFKCQPTKPEKKVEGKIKLKVLERYDDED